MKTKNAILIETLPFSVFLPPILEYGLFENSKTDPKARIAVFREGTSDFVKFPDYDMSPF